MADEIKDRLTVTRELGGPGRVTIYWECVEGQTEWEAHRLVPARPHVRMEDLDCPDVLSVFKLIRDILYGKIEDSVLMR